MSKKAKIEAEKFIPINIIRGRFDPKTDKFKQLYDIEGAIPVMVEASYSSESNLFKGRPIVERVRLQLILLPDGSVKGRIVG